MNIEEGGQLAEKEPREIAPYKEYSDKETIYERRKEQLEMRLAGIRRSEFIGVLAEKYDVSANTIDQDWANRGDWILDMAGTTNVVGLVGAALSSFMINQEDRRKIIREIDYLLGEGDITPVAAINMKARMRKEIDDAEKARMELLMKLGILREAPKKLEIDKKEIKVEHKIDWTKKLGELSEEARKEFFDLIEGEDFSYSEGDE